MSLVPQDSLVASVLIRAALSHSVLSGLLWPHGLQPARLLCPWGFSARILEWVATLSSRGSSQPRDRTQVSNLGLLRCRQILYHLSHQGSPLIQREMKNLPDGSGAPSPTRAAVNDLPSPRPHSPSPQPPSLALPEEAPPGTTPPISDSPLLHPSLSSLSSCPSCTAASLTSFRSLL